MKKRVKFITGLILLILIGGISGVLAQGVIIPWLASFPSLEGNKLLEKVREQTTIINKTETITVKENFSVTETASKVLPSVVSIVTVDEQIKEQKINNQQAIKIIRDTKKTAKTGVIVTGDGLIVSVIGDEVKEMKENQNKTNYKVLLSDGRELSAQLKAIDVYSQLAFYKVEADNLPVASFGNSNDLMSGEKLIIAGKVGGEYENNFSLGIIKSIDRTFSLLNSELASSERMEGAILTEAEISFTNIGGAVIDFNGTLVGLANQVKKDGELKGFIIPLTVVQEAISRLSAEGNLERPILGIYYLSLNRKIALANNLPINEGALIYSFSGQQGLAVIKNSPADKAGLKINDIIIAVNENKIDLDYPLSRRIAESKPGEEISLKILRKGEEQTVKVKLK